VGGGGGRGVGGGGGGLGVGGGGLGGGGKKTDVGRKSNSDKPDEIGGAKRSDR